MSASQSPTLTTIVPGQRFSDTLRARVDEDDLFATDALVEADGVADA